MFCSSSSSSLTLLFFINRSTSALLWHHRTRTSSKRTSSALQESSSTPTTPQPTSTGIPSRSTPRKRPRASHTEQANLSQSQAHSSQTRRSILSISSTSSSSSPTTSIQKSSSFTHPNQPIHPRQSSRLLARRSLKLEKTPPDLHLIISSQSKRKSIRKSLSTSEPSNNKTRPSTQQRIRKRRITSVDLPSPDCLCSFEPDGTRHSVRLANKRKRASLPAPLVERPRKKAKSKARDNIDKGMSHTSFSSYLSHRSVAVVEPPRVSVEADSDASDDTLVDSSPSAKEKSIDALFSLSPPSSPTTTATSSALSIGETSANAPTFPFTPRFLDLASYSKNPMVVVSTPKVDDTESSVKQFHQIYAFYAPSSSEQTSCSSTVSASNLASPKIQTTLLALLSLELNYALALKQRENYNGWRRETCAAVRQVLKGKGRPRARSDGSGGLRDGIFPSTGMSGGIHGEYPVVIMKSLSSSGGSAFPPSSTQGGNTQHAEATGAVKALAAVSLAHNLAQAQARAQAAPQPETQEALPST